MEGREGVFIRAQGVSEERISGFTSLPLLKPLPYASSPFAKAKNNIQFPSRIITIPSFTLTMAFPFEYEDLMSGNLKSVEAYNNQFDLTGKLNELRLLHKRKQQAAARPRLYNLEQQYARALPFLADFSIPYPSSSILTKLTHEFQLNIPPPLRHRPLSL